MKKAIVLGGTLPHIALIKKLKNRGFYVILVDYLDSPIAKSYADRHIQASTLDKDAVLEIAEVEKVKLVISTCIDQANVTSCYVAEQMGLPKPYSYETALAVTDKFRMKTLMIEHCIPTSKFIKITRASDLEGSGLKFPLIVKPVDCNSSKGVRRLDTYSGIDVAVEKAISLSRTHDAIIEEFVCGQEIGIDTFVINGKAKVVMIKERRKIIKNNGNLQQIKGCTWPMPGYKDIMEQAEEIGNKIANAFCLENCPLMIQAILKDSQISVIEFGARIGGGESFRIIKKLTTFDYIEASINSYLGEPVDYSIRDPYKFFADNFIYSRGCVFGHISVPQRLLQDGSISYINQLKNEGALVEDEISSNNRVGVVVVEADNIDELNMKIAKSLDAIQVFDVYGNQVMRKDIY